MAVSRLIKHNPSLLSDEELEKTFVVRKVELQILADLVRANGGEVNQHALVIGPRGMGKTTLVRRLALLVRSAEDLKDSWYPILAPEEIYDASSEGEIWLEILRSLAEQQRREQGEFERWNERYESLLKERDEDRLRARTLGALTEFSHEQGKRLLVLIENLQMLLGEQFNKDADWDLRRTLLNRPEIMLVLTATTRFEKIEQPAFAAFELFRELELRSLNTDSCRELWLATSGQDLSKQRIRPMEILTGGNPRLLAILATFAPERPLQELVDNLAELIDDHTPFLKSNIDSLPPQERRVFVNLAKLWEPSSARQVGDRCRLNSNTTSAVLKSLVKRGAVVEHGKKGRGKLYQVAERMYCVYYLMRLSGSEADRMRAFVRFMVPLYGEVNLARSLAEAACGAEAREREQFIGAFCELMTETFPEDTRRSVREIAPAGFLELQEIRDFLTGLKAAESLPMVQVKGSDDSQDFAERWIEENVALFEVAFEPADSQHFEQAVDTCDLLLDRYSRPSEGGWETPVIMAYARKGAFLRRLGSFEESIEACNEALLRGWDSKDMTLSLFVTTALENKGLALRSLGRFEEATAAFGKVLDRISDAHQPGLERIFTSAYGHRSQALRSVGRYEESLADLDCLLHRVADAGKHELASWVAPALVNKAFILCLINRPKAALEVNEEVLNRFAESEELVSQELKGKALLNKAVALRALGQFEEAMEQFDLIINQFSGAKDGASLILVTTALNGKAWLFYESCIGDLESAIDCGSRAVAISPDNDQYRHTLACLYGLAGRWDDAFSQLREFVDKTGFVETHLDHLVQLLTVAAADGQAKRALEELSGTATEAAMEPLVAALKHLEGVPLSAPQEVEEVKVDVLAKIEKRREELLLQRSRITAKASS